MSLEALTKFDVDYMRAPNAGKPPVLEWLSLTALYVNTDYQRPVTAAGLNTIKRIMADFSWSRFSPVIVRVIPGKVVHYEIIDGQHRATAAFNCGYDRVPCMVVHCSDPEAARIFAAVNGNVTPMQPLAVYKAALAGREPWALECKAAAEAAGCQLLTYPIPKAKQKPLQTMAVQGIRQVWRQHGAKPLEAAFRLLSASRGAEVPGFLTSLLIVRWTRVLASRPGWMANIERVRETLRVMALNLTLEEVEQAEHKIEQRIGDGRKGEALEDLKAKVAEAMGRRLSSQMIAASLRLPYAEVERLVAEIKGEKLLLEGAR